MKPRISMITLGVRDIEASLAFYQNVFRFPVKSASPEVVFFDLNGTWLGLFGRDALAEDANVPGEGSGFPGFSLAHNLASEVEVDQLFEELVAAGATAIKAPQKVFWGGYSSYIHDPDGYLWEIAYNPFEWIGPADPS